MDEFDLALDNLSEGDICHAHAGTDGDEGRAPAIELFHALGDQIDQDKWVADNFGGLIEEIAFHIGAGKSRIWLHLLKR